MPSTLSLSNDAKWHAQFDRLRKYMKENGGRVPYPRKDQDATTEAIGQWISKQRKLWRAGTLSEDRIELLKSVPSILLARQYSEYAEATPGSQNVDRIRSVISDAFSKETKTSFTTNEAISVVDAAISDLATEK